MTAHGLPGVESWQDREFVAEWAAGDTFGDLLALPRAIAAALVAHDRPATRLVVDIGCGPGAFLAAFLDRFPTAVGVAADVSEAMLELARERLAPYGDRVSYRLADMNDLAAAALPVGVDAVLTSRAAHHLDRPGLAAFYTASAAHLAPGGWLVNLDHTGPAEVWNERFRAIRPAFAPRRAQEPRHPHTYPLPSIADHLRGLAAAGLEDVEMPWKAFYTCLFAARRDG